MTHDEIISEVQAAGIDLDSAATRISRWLNNLIRDMAASSGWVKGTPTLATTVAGQDTYTVPDNVVRVLTVRVGEGATYFPVGVASAWDLRATRLRQSGDESYFAELYDDSGTTKQIVLYPPPSEAGDPIEALAVLYPSSISGNTEPPFPREYDMALVSGCVAIGLRLGDEDHDAADRHQAIFDAAKERLRRQANVRVAGKGPHTAKLVGFHF